MSSSYQDVVMALATPPSSYWPMDEATGDALDVVSNVDLTLVGTGTASRAYATGLDGLPAGIRLGATPWTALLSAIAAADVVSDQCSISGWFQDFEAPPGGTRMYLNLGYSGGHVDPFYIVSLQNSTASHFWFVTVDNGAAFAFDPSTVPEPGVDGIWHHLAVVYDGISKQVWVDAVKVVDIAQTGNSRTMSKVMFGGAPNLTSDGSESHDMGLAEWGWWPNHALSGAEILSLYNARLSGYEAAVLADTPVTWLRMQELATGVSLADSSGNSHPFAEGETGGTRTFGIPTPVGSAIEWTSGGSSYTRFSPNRDTDLFSFECVVKPPDNTGSYTVWADTDGLNGNGWTLFVHNGKMAVIWNGGGFHDLTDAAFNDADFHHFILTYDGTTVLGYLDGVLQSATFTPGAAPVPSAGQTVNVAKVLGSTSFEAEAGVQFGDLAYYHSVLSAGRVTAHFDAFSGGAASQNLPVPFIANGTTLYTPTLMGGNAEVFAPFISPATVLYTPTLMDDQDEPIPFISPVTVLYTMLLTYPQSPAVPFIASSTVLHAPVLHHPPPVLNFVIPALGRVGDTVNLVGLNFSGATAVTFNGVSASYVVDSDSSVSAVIPIGATSGPVEISTPEASDDAPYDFTVLAPIPVDPGARRFRQGYRWRFLFADLDCVTVTMPNDLITQRRISQLLNASTVIEAAVFPDDFRVNGIWDDGYPRIAQSNRIVFAFRREGGSPPWKVRAAGILMSPEDEGSEDIPTSHFTAYDPWKLLEARPVVNADGELPDVDGFNYFNEHGSVTAVEILNNSINNGPDGNAFIDLGLANGGTFYWNGVIEQTERINFQVQYGTMVADALAQLCDAGNMDIVLTPIYDPIRRPGLTHDLSIEKLAGSTRRDAIFAWDRLSRNLGKIDRMHDGTPGSFFNKVQYHAGQGGFAIPAAGPLVNAASVAAFGSYWATQFFPNQTDEDPLGSAVYAMAAQALEMAKQGRRTLTLYPLPERAPVPLVDYKVGDRVPVYASKALRVTADGLQRIEGIPIEINDDSIETVMALLCSPDFRPAT